MNVSSSNDSPSGHLCFIRLRFLYGEVMFMTVGTHLVSLASWTFSFVDKQRSHKYMNSVIHRVKVNPGSLVWCV